MRKYLTGISGTRPRRYSASRTWESTTPLKVVIRRAEKAPAASAVRDSRAALAAACSR